MGFKRPDFGFNDSMIFGEVSNDFMGDQPSYMQAGWRKFMDAISLQPQNERIKNYIDFIHQKKI
jgi:hypothetical protein